MKDITHRFPLDEVDHDELMKVFELRYETCWRVATNHITFPAKPNYSLKIKSAHGQIDKIYAGETLSDSELNSLLDQIDLDLTGNKNTEFGRAVLFANLPVEGGFRFDSIPMQILPAPARAPRSPQIRADNPFVLEYTIRASRTPELRTWRRIKGFVEWARILNVLLIGSIRYSGSRSRQMWVAKTSLSPEKCFWAHESYFVPGLEFFKGTLSRRGKSRLPIVPADTYYGDWEKHVALVNGNIDFRDQLIIPDNLDKFLAAFLSLKGEKRQKFLRSAAAIYYAKELWDVSFSSSFLACVQAIEILTVKPSKEPCPACGLNKGDGPTKQVKKIIEKYCSGMAVDKGILDDMYRVRSSLAHGDYLFQLDESPWAFGISATIANHREELMMTHALTIAKEVLRKWLLENATQQ